MKFLFVKRFSLSIFLLFALGNIYLLQAQNVQISGPSFVCDKTSSFEYTITINNPFWCGRITWLSICVNGGTIIKHFNNNMNNECLNFETGFPSGSGYNHSITIKWDKIDQQGNIVVTGLYSGLFCTQTINGGKFIWHGSPNTPTVLNAPNTSVGNTVTFSTLPVNGAQSYLWNATLGYTIGNGVNVSYTATNPGNGSVSVVANNVCGNSNAKFANFYVADNMIVQIDGVNYLESGQYSTWTANIIGGTPPYSYSWYTSTDGYSYNLNTLESYLTSQMPYSNNLYILLEVSDYFGRYGTSYFTVYNFGNISQSDSMETTLESDEDKDAFILKNAFINNKSDVFDDSKEFIIFPNPTRDQVYISNNHTSINTIEVYNNSGSILLKFDKIDSRFYSFDISKLRAGYYIVRITSENKIINKKLIIDK